MKNYYLKFKDKQDLESSLINVGLAEMHNDVFVAKVDLDVIGIINKPTGVMITNDDGFEYPEMLPVDGYHANLKADLTQEQQELLPLVSAPKHPVRVWA
jgi:hypothetical protein